MKSENQNEIEDLRDFEEAGTATDVAEEEIPLDADESAMAMSEELETLRKERDEYCDLLLRKQAEFENYRKRVLRERDEQRVHVKAGLLEELLPVLDACEKGLEAMQQTAQDQVSASFLEGYDLLVKQLKQLLERHGVTEIPGPGSIFDPNVHEAVLREVNSDFKENEIIEEYRKGYLIEDKLLRASQVKVATWPED